MFPQTAPHNELNKNYEIFSERKNTKSSCMCRQQNYFCIQKVSNEFWNKTFLRLHMREKLFLYELT